MQLGLFYQIQVPKPWTAESESQRFWEMIEQVTYAEEIGMESVWFVEHHFRSEWSHSSAPDITLAALSQRTSKMCLGIAVVLVPLHHPRMWRCGWLPWTSSAKAGSIWVSDAPATPTRWRLLAPT